MATHGCWRIATASRRVTKGTRWLAFASGRVLPLFKGPTQGCLLRSSTANLCWTQFHCDCNNVAGTRDCRLLGQGDLACWHDWIPVMLYL
jgi:hypothetical protein